MSTPQETSSGLPGACRRCGATLEVGGLATVCPRCVLGDLLSAGRTSEASSELNLDDIPAGRDEPECVGDYRLDVLVAQGGMGVVYKARQLTLGRDVAIKLLLGGIHAGPEFRRRFRQEAEMAARLQHPNIVPIYEIGEHNGLPFFTMEYVDGADLGAVSREKPLAPAVAAAHVACVARGVAYAHQQGVLHRDLKPSNILLGPDGRPRITDFGLARRMDEGSSLTMTGELLGTPGFLPPEQASIQRGAVGVWSDIYSLGATCWWDDRRLWRGI